MMKRQSLNHWGGAAFMLGSFLFLLNKLNEMSRLFLGRWLPDVIAGQDVGLIALGQVALIVGLVAYYRQYAPRVGWFGRQTLRLFCGGGVVLAIGHVAFMPVLDVDWLFVLVLIGVAAMILGLLGFGISNLRQARVGRWPWLPFSTGVMGFIGFFLASGAEITALFLTFRTLFALGLLGLGLSLWLEEPGTAPLKADAYGL